jgi:hypothetical protein
LTKIKLDGSHAAVRDRCATGWEAWQGLPRLINRTLPIAFGVDRHQIAAQAFGLGLGIVTGSPDALLGRPHEKNPHIVRCGHGKYGIACRQMEEPVRIALSLIKADIGAIGGQIAPSRRFLEMAMRRQGFFGAAMLPMSELEYTGIIETLCALDGRFSRLRRSKRASRGLGNRFCMPRLP